MNVPFLRIDIPDSHLEKTGHLMKDFLENPGRLRHLAEHRLGELLRVHPIFLTPSCTHAMEAMALAMDLSSGDEVIVPSFSYVTTASAFALRGCKIIFCDIDPMTMNIDLDHASQLINEKTRALVVMHYGGVACDMDKALTLCATHNILLLEDAAHAIGAHWKGRPLGTIGDAGAWSFHHTKNIQCGEGGALFFNNPSLREKARCVLEKGTDRQAFREKKVDHYQWISLGSSYAMSDPAAALLLPGLDNIQSMTDQRKKLWALYHGHLSVLAPDKIQLPRRDLLPSSNAHIFHLRCKDEEERSALITRLKNKGIDAYFHYPALHLTIGGRKFGSTPLPCPQAVRGSEQLLRLPLYSSLKEEEVSYVCNLILSFYGMEEGSR